MFLARNADCSFLFAESWDKAGWAAEQRKRVVVVNNRRKPIASACGAIVQLQRVRVEDVSYSEFLLAAALIGGNWRR
jgi:hypothetical protein